MRGAFTAHRAAMPLACNEEWPMPYAWRQGRQEAHARALQQGDDREAARGAYADACHSCVIGMTSRGGKRARVMSVPKGAERYAHAREVSK